MSGPEDSEESREKYIDEARDNGLTGIHWQEQEKLDYSTQSMGFKTFATNPQDQSVSFRGSRGLTVHYQVGDTVGKSYKLLKQIGQGGMGVVYLASHMMIDQQYALKILAPNQITESNWSRFEIEGRSLARINHQNIVKIYNMGIDEGGCPFYVMELLKGDALIDLMEKNLLDQKQILAIYSQACAGLASAHRNGIVHRDVKPSNIMICANLREKDAVKIVDFGIASMQSGQAKQTGQAGHQGRDRAPDNKGSQAKSEYWLQETDTQQQSITQAGEVFGSPFYMSPEQCSGEKVDVRSDIYSLGCSLYHTLTGKPPFIGKTAMDTLIQHVTKPAPTLSEGNGQRQYAPSLEQLVAKLLHKNPARRYQSMEQVMHDIDRIAAGKTITASGQSSTTLSDGSSINIRALPQYAKTEAEFEDNVEDEADDTEHEQNHHRMLTRFFKVGAIVSILIIGATMVFMMCQPPPPPAAVKKVDLEARAKENDAVGEEAKKYAFTEAAEHPVCTELHRGQKMLKITFPTDISIGDIATIDAPVIKETAKNTVFMPPGREMHFSINKDIETFPPFLAVLKSLQIRIVDLRNVDTNLAEVFLQLAQYSYLKELTLENVKFSRDSLTALHAFSHLKLLNIKECEGEALDLADTTLIKRLEGIRFTGYTLRPALVEEIYASPSIVHIDVNDCSYAANFCEMMARKPNLVKLIIDSDNLHDSELDSLSKSKTLIDLEVKGRQFSQAAAQRLATIKTLKRLVISSPLVWDRLQLQKINATLPRGAHPVECRSIESGIGRAAGELFNK